jgi:predicted TIM-barrel fold metal-dependent hydrolase
MLLDCHVHISAMIPGHGFMSRKLLDSFAFKFMRWRFGLVGEDEQTERELEQLLVDTIDDTPMLGAAVVLAFDGVYDDAGELDLSRTHFYVTNDYVHELSLRHPKVLFGASVNPYRRDAIKELERCTKAGAVLMKWLPIVQGFDPSDPRCFEFYDALVEHQLPLLAHTGGERSLPRVNDAFADPMLLVPALKRGVTVIMAHCGTRSVPGEADFVDAFIRLAKEYPNCFGDTSALGLPTRWHAWPKILGDKTVREKLIHGSDWPIISMPPITRLPMSDAVDLMQVSNWMQRDILIKNALGLDEAYWNRAAEVLGINRRRSARNLSASTSPVAAS